MPRKSRMYMAGVPCHVIQRGNNRDACFFAPQDYQFYLECLSDAGQRHRVAIHAYVLMTNHVHLLMTPTNAEGISRVMQSLGRRYVQYVNNGYRRCGTLWESRHKASLVDAERYLLACYRYIELNPVRANIVRHPGEYRWSSFRCNGMGERNALISTHSLYWHWVLPTKRAASLISPCLKLNSTLKRSMTSVLRRASRCLWATIASKRRSNRH